MKLQKALWLPAVVAALSGVSTAANAAGTTAGTSITNTASVGYAVGGTSQTAVNSNTAEFLVDLKVSFTLTRIATETYASANDGLAMTIAGYTITNTGNAPTSFAIGTPDLAQANGTSVAVANQGATLASVTDTINAPSNTLTYWSSTDTTLDTATDTNITTRTLNAGVYTSDALASLVPADGTLNIFVQMTDSGFVGVDGDIAAILSTVYGYKAEVSGAIVNLDKSNDDPTDGTTTDDNGSADVASTVQIVYADTDANNTETLKDAVELVFPKISVVKTSAVISDPINGVSNDAKAIPGAVIEYTLTAQNTGRAAASNVTLSDAIPTNTTYVVSSIVNNGTTESDAADTDGSDYNATAASKVTSNVGTVGAGTVATPTTKTVKFRVTIN